MSSSSSIFKAIGNKNPAVSITEETSSNSEIASINANSSSSQGEMKDEFGCHEINSIMLSKIANKEDPSRSFMNYTAYVRVNEPQTKDFIYFANDKYKSKSNSECSDVGILFKIYGLKFHISLPEDDENARVKGWKIIKDILISKNINGFKIIKKGEKMSDNEDSRGKDITIYANLNPELKTRDWQVILHEITVRLTQEGVPPGYRCPGANDKPEKPVKGSNYITYRYYDEANTSRSAVNQIALRNLAQKTQKDTGETKGWPNYDPIAKFVTVNVENQPNIPDFKAKNTNITSESRGVDVYSNKPK